MEKMRIKQTAEISKTITQQDVDTFIKLTGDTNSVHKEIVHGMLVCSFISTMIGTELPGEGSIWLSHHIDFIAPIYVGEKLTIKAEVVKIEGDRYKLWIDVFNPRGLAVSTNGWVKWKDTN